VTGSTYTIDFCFWKVTMDFSGPPQAPPLSSGLRWRARKRPLRIEGNEERRSHRTEGEQTFEPLGEDSCPSFASICARASRPFIARRSAASYIQRRRAEGRPLPGDRRARFGELRFRSELPRHPPHRGLGDHPDHLERGRTVEQKKALYKAIADRLATSLSLRREDVFISLIDVKRENWSFGNGIAQYA
jgi:phenylpyruvate tautomerase PptA (4-oxalocrotonate tautomerase family)